MVRIINLPTFGDYKRNLIVVEKEEIVLLTRQDTSLVLDTKDWHTMDKFSKDSTFFVFIWVLWKIGIS